MFVRLFSFAFIMLFSSLDIFSMRDLSHSFKIYIYEANLMSNGHILYDKNDLESIFLDIDEVQNCLNNNLDLVVFVKDAINKYFSDRSEDFDVEIIGISGLVIDDVLLSKEENYFPGCLIKSDSSKVFKNIFDYHLGHLNSDLNQGQIKVYYTIINKKSKSGSVNNEDKIKLDPGKKGNNLNTGEKSKCCCC